MKKCPVCNLEYSDETQTFCQRDGSQLKYFEPQNNSVTAAAPAKKRNKVLIFGGIAAVILLLGGILLAGVIVAGVLALRPHTSADTPFVANSPVVQTTPAPNKNDKYKSELIAAIEGADRAQMVGEETYDTSLMEHFYTGEILQSYLANIKEMQGLKLYHSSTLENRQIESVSVSDDEKQAEVEMSETWSMIVRRKPSGKCVEEYKSYTAPQIVHFERGNEGWKINAIDYDAAPKPSPCSPSK